MVDKKIQVTVKQLRRMIAESLSERSANNGRNGSHELSMASSTTGREPRLFLDVETPEVHITTDGKLVGVTTAGKKVSLGSVAGWKDEDWRQFFNAHRVKQIVSSVSSKRVRPGTYSPERFMSMLGGQ